MQDWQRKLVRDAVIWGVGIAVGRVIIGLVMHSLEKKEVGAMASETYRIGQAREGEERGRGVPRTDVERVMAHYGVDEKTACEMLATHTVEELLPERGYGLTK